MRLIDADALKKKAVMCPTVGNSETLLLDISDVENAPTIEERKTGRWVIVESGDTDLYECSLCRNRKTHMTPFCDICGAKMESGDNNGTD
jgi:hypothetical protein